MYLRDINKRGKLLISVILWKMHIIINNKHTIASNPKQLKQQIMYVWKQQIKKKHATYAMNAMNRDRRRTLFVHFMIWKCFQQRSRELTLESRIDDCKHELDRVHIQLEGLESRNMQLVQTNSDYKMILSQCADFFNSTLCCTDCTTKLHQQMDMFRHVFHNKRMLDALGLAKEHWLMIDD